MNRYILALVACYGLANTPTTQTIGMHSALDNDAKILLYKTGGIVSGCMTYKHGIACALSFAHIVRYVVSGDMPLKNKQTAIPDLLTRLKDAFSELTWTTSAYFTSAIVFGYLTYACFKKASDVGKEKSDDNIDQNDDQQ